MISSKVTRNTSNMIPRLSTRDLTKTRTVDPKVQTYGEAFCIHDCNVSIIFCHVVVSLDSVKDAVAKHSSGTSTCKKSVDQSFSDLFHFGGMPFKNSDPHSHTCVESVKFTTVVVVCGCACDGCWLLVAVCLFVLLTSLLEHTQALGGRYQGRPPSYKVSLQSWAFMFEEPEAPSLSHGDVF